MTSRICSKEYHPALRLFGFTLKRQMGITFLVTAFLLLICPGLLWQNVVNDEYDQYRLLSEGFAVWALVIFIISLVLGIILLCFNHSHLFSRKTADLYYALPVKRDTLLAIRGGAAYIGAAFAMTLSFLGLATVNFLPRVYGVSALDLVKIYVLCLMALLLCMSTVLIFVVNSGSIFHFLFSIAVVCIGVPLLCLIANEWYAEAAYGISAPGNWICYSSPFVYVVYCIMRQGDFLRTGKATIEVSMVLVALGQTLLYIAASFLLNHRRKAERSGSSFAFKAVPAVITVIASVLGGFVIGLIFSGSWRSEGEFWIFFALGAMLTAVAAGAIITKGFHKIWRWLVSAGAATVVFLAVFLAATNLALHDSRYVPDLKEIDCVVLKGDYSSPTVTLEQQKDVELLLDLHKHIADGWTGKNLHYGVEVYEAYDMEGCDWNYSLVLPDSINIVYHLKDGRTMERSYRVNDGDIATKIKYLAVIQTDAYAKAWVNDLIVEKGTKVYLNTDYGEENGEALVSEEEMREFFTLFGRELQNAKQEDVFPEKATFVWVSFCGENSLALEIPDNASFAGSLSWIRAHLEEE